MDFSFKKINLGKEHKAYKPLVYTLWALLALALISIMFILISAASDLPSFAELENPQYDEASIIYDVHGTEFGKYYVENRVLIDYDELNPLLLKSLLATEDIRFHRHTGIDFKALFRVAIKTVLLRQESSGGGSTISQQLAKLLFKRPSLANKSFFERATTLLQTKIKEWITAVRLEKEYTKEEIIAMYLNKFEFINGAHGIQAASETYFGKDQSELDLGQAALLVGMLKNPSLYNPLRFPENATQRRNVVLRQVNKNYNLDQELIDSIRQNPVDMSAFNREAHDTGPAPYFRSELTKWLQKLFDEKNIKKPDGTDYNIYTDGLRIHTTLDLNFQAHAEQAVVEHMKKMQKRYWQVWKNRNPWTYDAGKQEREIRQQTLDRKVKESERYLNLHDTYLSSIKTRIAEELGAVRLSENIIKALIKVEQNELSMDAFAGDFNLSRSQKDIYKKILDKDAYWDELKSQYLKLQDDFVDIFNTPIEMEVFAYNEDGFVRDTMSPLDSVKYHNQHLQAGMLAVHPQTGHIKAWVGGVGFNYFKYDHVNSRRQVGSTIKPFVYATAISLMGLSPCQVYDDIQYTIAPGDANFEVDKEWSPSNANGEFTGNPYNLYQGLLYSKNSITVKLVKEMGNVDVIRELLDNAGIHKDQKYPNGQAVVPNVPSICLGALDLTLHEMAGAYTTFANDGIATEPIFVSHIEDKSGRLIYTGVADSKRAINRLYNGVMVDMLKNNVGGSFKMGVKSPIGGKTGTTNDYADGWFMAITPDLVTGVWVGGDDKWIRFLTLDDGQGFIMARPIVQKFIQALESDSLSQYDYDKQFPLPPEGFLDFIDCEKYKQMSVEEEQTINELNKRADQFEESFDDEFGDFESQEKKDTTDMM